jgi:DNA-binding transcriptional regulator GbsR (MarR family)
MQSTGLSTTVISTNAKKMQRTGLSTTVISTNAKKMQRTGLSTTVFRGDVISTNKYRERQRNT